MSDFFSGCEGDDCPEVTSDGLGGIFLNVHPTFECKKGINEKMKDPESCSRFIQCMDGFAYHFACQVVMIVYRYNNKFLLNQFCGYHTVSYQVIHTRLVAPRPTTQKS